MRWLPILLVALTLLVATRARAEVLQAPVGARAFSLGSGRVACEAPQGGWALESAGRSVRPPATSQAIGLAVDLKVGASREACRTSPSTVRLVSTAHLPRIDRKSVELFLDEGRLEMRGSELQGSFVSWPSPKGLERDSCGAIARGGRVARVVGSALALTAPGSSPLRLARGRQLAADAVLSTPTGAACRPGAEHPTGEGARLAIFAADAGGRVRRLRRRAAAPPGHGGVERP